MPLGIPDPAETARIAAEEEAARIAAEQEAARIAAEQESARKAAEQEAARIAAEQELEKSMEEIDLELEEVSTTEAEVDQTPQEAVNVSEEKTIQATTSGPNHLQMIEFMNSMKLSSQIRDAVEKTKNLGHHFEVKIGKIESTLMAPSPFKNGKTIIGNLVEDDSIEVELLFESSANDLVNNFQTNHIVEIDAHIASWNIGRKRAVFSVLSYDYK